MAPIKAPRVENTHPPVSYAFVKSKDEERHRINTVSFNTVDIHLRSKGDMRGFSSKLHGPACPSSYRGKSTDLNLGSLSRMTHAERSLELHEKEKVDWRRKTPHSNHFKRNGGGKSAHAVILKDVPLSFEMDDLSTRSEIVLKTVLDSFPKMYFDFVRDFMDRTMGPRMKDYLKRRMESLELLITPGTEPFRRGQVACWKAYYQMSTPADRILSDEDIGSDTKKNCGFIATMTPETGEKKTLYTPAFDHHMYLDANTFNHIPDFNSCRFVCDVFSIKECVKEHIKSLKSLYNCCDGFANSVSKARLALEYIEMQGKEMCDDKARIFRGNYDFDAVELKVPFKKLEKNISTATFDLDEKLMHDLSVNASVRDCKLNKDGLEFKLSCCVPVGKFMGDFEKVCIESFSEFTRRNTTHTIDKKYFGTFVPSSLQIVNETLSNTKIYSGSSDNIFLWKWGVFSDAFKVKRDQLDTMKTDTDAYMKDISEFSENPDLYFSKNDVETRYQKNNEEAKSPSYIEERTPYGAADSTDFNEKFGTRVRIDSDKLLFIVPGDIVEVFDQFKAYTNKNIISTQREEDVHNFIQKVVEFIQQVTKLKILEELEGTIISIKYASILLQIGRIFMDKRSEFIEKNYKETYNEENNKALKQVVFEHILVIDSNDYHAGRVKDYPEDNFKIVEVEESLPVKVDVKTGKKLVDVKTDSATERVEQQTFRSDLSVPPKRVPYGAEDVENDKKYNLNAASRINKQEWNYNGGLFPMFFEASQSWRERVHTNSMSNIRSLPLGQFDKLHYWSETFVESFSYYLDTLGVEKDGDKMSQIMKGIEVGYDTVRGKMKEPETGTFPVSYLGRLCERSRKELYPNIHEEDTFFNVLSSIRRSSIMWYTTKSLTSEMNVTSESLKRIDRIFFPNNYRSDSKLVSFQATTNNQLQAIKEEDINEEDGNSVDMQSRDSRGPAEFRMPDSKFTQAPKNMWVPVAFQQQHDLLSSCGLVESDLLPKSVWTDETLDLEHIFHQSYHNSKQEYASGVETDYKDTWASKYMAMKVYQPTTNEVTGKKEDSDRWPKPFSLCGGTLVQADFLKSHNDILDMGDSDKENNETMMRFEYLRHIIHERFGETGHLPLSLENTISPQYLNDMCLGKMAGDIHGLRGVVDTEHEEKGAKELDSPATHFSLSSWMAYARVHALMGMASRQQGTEMISESRFMENYVRLFITPNYISRKTTDEWAPACMGVQPSSEGTDHLFSCISLGKLRDLISERCSPLAGSICDKNPVMAQAVDLAKTLEENLYSRIQTRKDIEDLWSKMQRRGIGQVDFLQYLMEGIQGYANVMKNIVLRLMVSSNPSLAPLADKNLHIRPLDYTKIGDPSNQMTTSSFSDPRFDATDYVEGTDPSLSLGQLINISNSSDRELNRLLSVFTKAKDPRIVKEGDQTAALKDVLQTQYKEKAEDMASRLFNTEFVPTTSNMIDYFKNPTPLKSVSTIIATPSTDRGRMLGFQPTASSASKKHTMQLAMTPSMIADKIRQVQLDTGVRDVRVLMEGHFNQFPQTPYSVQAEVARMLGVA